MDLIHEVNHSYVLFMVNMHYCKLSLKLWKLFIIYLQVDSHVINSELHRPSINTEGIYHTPETNKTEPSLLIPSHSQVVQTMKKLKFWLFFTFFKKKLENISLFDGTTDTPVFGFLVMSVLGFKARVDSLICVLHHLYATDSSDQPLVRHLLTHWRSAWWPSRFDPRTWLEY